jgi:hypothetical protein
VEAGNSPPIDRALATHGSRFRDASRASSPPRIAVLRPAAVLGLIVASAAAFALVYAIKATTGR